MRTSPVLHWVVSLASASAIAAVACSSGGDNGSSGGASGSNSSFRARPTTSRRSCSDADLKPFSDCVAKSCEVKFRECYGADYLSGTFAGPCGPYISCAQKCACNDQACTSDCAQMQGIMECTKCLGTLACSDSCTLPACSSTGGSSSSSSSGAGGGKTCADLLACCNGLQDADSKQGCTAAHGMASGNDATCDQYYSAFKSGGFCN